MQWERKVETLRGLDDDLMNLMAADSEDGALDSISEEGDQLRADLQGIIYRMEDIALSYKKPTRYLVTVFLTPFDLWPTFSTVVDIYKSFPTETSKRCSQTWLPRGLQCDSKIMPFNFKLRKSKKQTKPILRLVFHTQPSNSFENLLS